MKQITSQSVKQLWAMMSQHYDTEIIQSGSALEMKAVAAFLDAIGIEDSKKFMESTAVTIDHRIYLPFRPGVEDNFSLLVQAVICAHEHQHVVVMEEEGTALYNLYYLTVPAKRAIYEMRCYQASAEVLWQYYKATQGMVAYLGVWHLEDTLEWYGCDAKASAPAIKAFAKARKVIEKGGVGCRAAQDVIKFFGWMEE